MSIFASPNRLNLILNSVRDNNIVPDELKVETEQILLKNIQRIKLTTNPRRLNDDELQLVLSENYPIITSVESFIEDASTILDPNTALGLLDLNGVFFLSGSKEKVGLSCPEAAKVFRTNRELGRLFSEGNALEIHYDGPQAGAAAILDKHGKIRFYMLARNEVGPLSSTAWHMLYLSTQLVQQQYFCLEMLNEYSTSFMSAIPEPAIILDTNINITHANEPCLSLLGLDDSYVLPRANEYSLMAHNKPITSLSTILSSEIGDRFSIQATNVVLPCDVINQQLIDTPYGKRVILLFKESSVSTEKTGWSLPNGLADISAFDKIIGNSHEIRKIKAVAKQVAQSPSTVLIEGESGTGKELFAEAIHLESQRNGQFVAINCGGIPSELLQSELFGYEEGSFTGAKRGGKRGLFEIADGGTLFLDEIGEMPVGMQVSLLRFLQDKMVTRIGGDKPKKVDVRIIAATNRNLKNEVEDGNFREDLYYRLNVINLQIPPLRERKEDIPLISNFMLKMLCNQYDIPVIYLNKQKLTDLLSYDWPGNIRELANIIERAFLLRQGDKLVFSDILKADQVNNEILDRTQTLDRTEKQIIEKYLQKYQNNISLTAKALNITRQTLYRKMKTLKVDRDACVSLTSR